MINKYLSVVIPAYNEQENFQRGVLDQVFAYLIKAPFTWEVILVDDGSIDKTNELLNHFSKDKDGFIILKIKHGGKLKAIEEGVKAVKGEIILFSDFDQSTPISEFEKFIQEFKTGADIVIGSRTGPKSKRINDPWLRYFRSRVLNWVIKITLFKGIDDTQCGFKAFKKDISQKLFFGLKATRLAKPVGGFMGPFDIELLFLAKKFKYNIISVPISWEYFPSKRLSVLSEPLRFLYDIFTIRKFDLLGKSL